MVPGLGTCSTRPRGNNMIWPKNNINSTTLYMICVAITLNVAWYLRCIFLHRSLSCPQRQATDFEQEYVINIQGNNPPPPTYLLNLCVFLLPSEENKLICESLRALRGFFRGDGDERPNVCHKIQTFDFHYFSRDPSSPLAGPATALSI